MNRAEMIMGEDALDGSNRLDELDGPDALEAGTREESVRRHCAILATPPPCGGEREALLRHPGQTRQHKR